MKINKRDLAYTETRERILKASSNLFVKYGFNGVSMSEIAKEAQVNQSLIYHYFISKEELWKSVKIYFVENFFNQEDLKLDPTRGFKNILLQIVTTRFDFYDKHPEALRLMGWQRLEPMKELLAGGSSFSSDNWKQVFTELQNNGEIREDVDLDLMILFISSSISGAFTEDYSGRLRVPENKIKFLDMLLHCFMVSFAKER